MKRSVKVGVVSAGFIALLLIWGLFGASSKSRPPIVSVNVGKTEIHSSLSSTTSSSTSDNARFAYRRLLLMVDERDALDHRIATLLAAKLKDVESIEEVEVADVSKPSPQTNRAPDLFLRIDLSGLKPNGIISSSMSATVAAFLGNAPWQSDHYVQEPATPPLVDFAWNATLDSEITFSGVRSDRYGAIVESVADEFAKGVSNQIQTFSAKYHSLPTLPPEFYGPYEPVSDFEFLKEFGARRLCSYFGLFTRNQTFWRFQAGTNSLPQLQHAIAELEADQWKVTEPLTTITGTHFARLRNGDATLEIFAIKPTAFPLRDAPESPLQFVVHYRKAFSRTEREAALEKLFTENGSLEALLPFRHSFSPDQRERFYELVDKTPAASPRACLELAEVNLQRGQTNAALHQLLRAKALEIADFADNALETDIDSVAKTISPHEKLNLDVTPELCRELGFLEITNGPQRFELERAIGEPVLLFTTGERGIETCAVVLNHQDGATAQWSVTRIWKGSRSWSSTKFGWPRTESLEESFSLGNKTGRVTIHSLPDGKRVSYAIETGSDFR